MFYYPAKDSDQQHSKKQNGCSINRTCLREEIQRLWHLEELLQKGAEEEHDGDGTIGREGQCWEDNNAEPPMIWE